MALTSHSFGLLMIGGRANRTGAIDGVQPFGRTFGLRVFPKPEPKAIERIR